MWPKLHRILNLGTGEVGFDEGLFAIAFAVSDGGHVVGTMSSPVEPHAVAFLWTRKLGKVDVNELIDESGEGWRVIRAEDVNSRGQIVGSACRADLICYAVLLTPNTNQ